MTFSPRPVSHFLSTGPPIEIPEARHIRAKPPYVDVKRVLAILNSLYPNKAFALVRENLQNSIDAGARNIWITFNPEERRATFVDDGTGIPIGQMDERHYFGVTWSTKRGKDLIGSKGIGRLTNIASGKSVRVETYDGRNRGVFTWHSTGSFSKHRSAATTLERHGLSITIRGLHPIVSEDLPGKVEEVATDVFDEWLRQERAVWFNGIQVKTKEYRGHRTTYKLRSGGELHLYWSREGQDTGDWGVVMKCRGVRVGDRTRFGIDSEEWRNVAGILHLDHLSLTANRDAFEDTPAFRAARDEAVTKIRGFLARYEGGRRQRLDKMAEEYTRAALQAAQALGINLALLGPPADRRGAEAHFRETVGDGERAQREPSTEHDTFEAPATRKRDEGDEPGFRLIPKNFELDDELRKLATDMSTRKGPVIFVNLGHPACPKNKHARSMYIWCCAFAEIVRWGALSRTEDLNRDRLIASYRGWLQGWTPNLVRFSPGAD